MHLPKGIFIFSKRSRSITHPTFYISYKFHRLFPLSQYDLPSHNSKILSFPRPFLPECARQSPDTSESPSDLAPPRITQEQISQNNPDVDYTRLVLAFGRSSLSFHCSTRPDLISLVFSDVGSLTPEGVSQYLVGMFSG